MVTKEFVRGSTWGVEGTSNKNKAGIIALVLKHFYDPSHPTGSSPNRQAMEELQQQSNSLVLASDLEQPRAPEYGHGYLYHYQRQQYDLPHTHGHGHANVHQSLMPTPAQAALNMSSLMHNSNNNRNQAVPTPAPASIQMPLPHSNSNNSNVRVKLEGHNINNNNNNNMDNNGWNNQDEGCHPRNPLEMHLLAQLSDMGFTDRREIIESIRRLQGSNPAQPPSVDSVMVAIITEREEAEEAKKMDEARLLSEQARKEDARRRRDLITNDIEERIKKATMEDWRRNANMFPDSWILAGDACYAVLASLIKDTLLKYKLMALLKLEKQAKKWYGKVLPRGYFARCVTERLEQATANSMAGKLQMEVDALEVAMYQLSEQKGGVPRIFLEAHDDANEHDANERKGDSGLEAHDDANEHDANERKGDSGASDSDDMVVLVVPVGTGTNASLPCAREKPAGRSEPEVLEIL
jgi:hypothetical protein